MSPLLYCVTLLLSSSNILIASASELNKRQAPAGVPQFVLDYAPIVFLYSGETYFPADIGAQLAHTQPYANFTTLADAPDPLTLVNLAELNGLGGEDVYLTATTPPNDDPVAEWLVGVRPSNGGVTEGARSCAVILRDHGDGTVDAFYMYFYAFDFGGVYLDVLNIGNHVGDWEYNMIRFKDGIPDAMWYSQHSFGQAFTYNATQKYANGQRPIAYSANGTHANYAIDGTHNHAIPGLNTKYGLVLDYTDDAGSVWDPVASAYFVSYDADTGAFSAYDDTTPTSWLDFEGRWGDKQYRDGEKGQKSYLDLAYKYVDGPTGPRDKQLVRKDVCPEQEGTICVVQPRLEP